MTSLSINKPALPNNKLELERALCRVYNLAKTGKDFREALSSPQIPKALQQKVSQEIQKLGATQAHKMALQEGLLPCIDLTLDDIEKPSLPKTVVDRIYSFCDQRTAASAQAAPLKNAQLEKQPKKKNICEMIQFNPHRSVKQMREVYMLMGACKWVECVDGEDHDLGPWVYDKGLHGKKPEAGFLRSMLNGFAYIFENLGHKITAKYYLTLHKINCAHFKGKANGTIIDHSQTGKFRT